MHLSSDLSRFLQKSVSLSTFTTTYSYAPQSEEEMGVDAGQPLVIVLHDKITNIALGEDRWASMDDDIDLEIPILEITYEPDLRDIAATIMEFEGRQRSRPDCMLCLKINATGHLLGAGEKTRGKAKVELEDIGLIPK